MRFFGVSHIGTHFFVLKEKNTMKYCAKCGTQMSDDTTLCSQCHPEINNKHSQIPNQFIPTKNATSKIIPLVLTNVIISMLTLIAVIIMYFITPPTNNLPSNNDNSNSNSNSDVVSSNCPADEYGNHDWSTPTCVNPAQCYKCDAYKDDKLGQHSFWTDSDGFNECVYCGILYEVYTDSLE